jgi:hypothetical protein
MAMEKESDLFSLARLAPLFTCALPVEIIGGLQGLNGGEPI